MVPHTRWLILCLGVVVAALVAGGVWLKWRRGPEPSPRDEPPARSPATDPRLTYDGPFLNVRPDVRYVGDENCVGCHDDVIETYRNHPMARTLAPIAAVAAAFPDDKAHHNPFESQGARYTIERTGNRVMHRCARVDAAGRPVCEQTYDVRYAVGSAKHGVSYVTDLDGHLVQTPISWFTQKQRWDVSPGFEKVESWYRPVHGNCLFCHANRAELHEGSINRYDPSGFDGRGIGCERCHGPAELHLRRLERHEKVQGGIDYTIVNPKHLDHARREAVCQQCHLEGEARVARRGLRFQDYRPGLPLESVMNVFVNVTGEGADQKAVNHVEQMYLSTCFRRGSEGRKLGCISCHDPHRAVGREERATWYRGRCLTCHQPESCTAPAADRRAKADSCIACHMPPYGSSDIAHTASTDHRILRRPPPPEEPGEHVDVPNRFWPDLPLVPFRREGLDPRDPELRRDLAVGLMWLASQIPTDSGRYADRMLQYLEPALVRDPQDRDALLAKANALRFTGRPAPALATLETLLEQAPEHEIALGAAAVLAQQLKMTDKALGYARRCVDVNPSNPDFRAGLTGVLASQGKWAEAAVEAEAWLRCDPCSVRARWQHVRCLQQLGKKAEARDEFRTIEDMRPPELKDLRAHCGPVRNYMIWYC
jgi:hypothetical protein